MRARLGRVFGSLTVRNYRLYFVGQLVSVTGIWMQQIAIAWLALRLTNSALALGLTVAIQATPYLVLGLWGGLLVDRFSKRRLLILTQLSLCVPSLLLWGLYESGSIRMWMIYAIVLWRGLINTVDNPVRATFAPEIVGRERVVNAVSLNASVIQAGRLLGPAVAAVVIATLGLGPCFLGATLTYSFMAVMVALMRPAELRPAPVAPRGKGQLREGLAHVRHHADLRVPIALMAVVGLLSFNFNVALPAVARFTYHGTATTYALMMNFLAFGALFGALASGARTAVTGRTTALASLAFGAALGVTAAVDVLWLALVSLLAVGAASTFFSASVQSVLQLTSEPAMRGRVLALYQVVYQGSTPLGAVIVGAMASSLGARSGLALGSIAALVAGAVVVRRRRGTLPAVPVAAIETGDAGL